MSLQEMGILIKMSGMKLSSSFRFRVDDRNLGSGKSVMEDDEACTFNKHDILREPKKTEYPHHRGFQFYGFLDRRMALLGSSVPGNAQPAAFLLGQI